MPDNRGFNNDRSSYPNNMPKHQPVKIEGFYKDGKIKEELFDKKAKDIADSFYGISGTQLRRIYDEVKRFEQKLNGDVESWSNNFPYIKMVKAKVSYSVARAIKNESKAENAYRNLSAFITEGIDLIKDEKDYHVFLSLFEAVYGYSYEKIRN